MSSSWYCRYQSLSPPCLKIFGSYFLVFGKCGVTPHRSYRGSLTLIFFFFCFFVNFCFLFPYVHEIQHNHNMKTHTCLLLSTMPKYIHTNMKAIYTNANTGVAVICICIYMDISIPHSFPPSLGSYIVYRNTWLGN